MQQTQPNEENNWVNVTSILFDDRLVLAVLTLHEQNPDECISLIKSFDHLQIAKGQAIIRNWFVQNQHMFNMKGPRLSLASVHMPNFYALLCLNICNVRECKSWNDVSSQIIDAYKTWIPEKNIIFCNFTIDTKISKCACSHLVSSENTYIIKNSITNLHIMLGSDCGEKLGIISKALFNKMNKPTIYEKLQLNRKLQNEENARVKNKSKQLTIKWGLLVNRLVTSIKNYRKCLGCDVRCIQKTSANWVIRCKPCYVRYKYPNSYINH